MSSKYDIYIDGKHLLEDAMYTRTSYSDEVGFIDSHDNDEVVIGFRYSIIGRIRHEKLLLKIINSDEDYTLEIILKNISHHKLLCKVTPKVDWEADCTISFDSV